MELICFIEKYHVSGTAICLKLFCTAKDWVFNSQSGFLENFTDHRLRKAFLRLHMTARERNAGQSGFNLSCTSTFPFPSVTMHMFVKTAFSSRAIGLLLKQKMQELFHIIEGISA